MAVYKWKSEEKFIPINPQVAGEYLEKLRKEKVHVDPITLLDLSKPVDATLHRCFEWDDRRAGNRFRLEQARAIIDSITVTVNQAPRPKPMDIRAEIHEETPTIQDRHTRIRAAIESDVATQKLRENAYRDLRAFLRKYWSLKEFAVLFATINDILPMENDSAVDEGM